jgi:hypothetical protein
MASVADMQLRVDVRLGLDGPAGEAVSLLQEFAVGLGRSECSRKCMAPHGNCYCVRVRAFLAAIATATDPKGAA